jgi:hypothetical protein
MELDKNSKGLNDYNSRPSCKELLENKDSWFLKRQEMDIEAQLVELEKKLTLNEKFKDLFHCFVQHINKQKKSKEIKLRA